MGNKDVIQISHGSTLQKTLQSVNASSDKVGVLMNFPVSVVESEDCQAGLLDVPISISDSHTLFPIPDSFRKLWEASRKSSSVVSGSIVPPLIRKSYRLPPEDWAYLGAIRRPDFILKKTCFTKT